MSPGKIDSNKKKRIRKEKKGERRKGKKGRWSTPLS